MKFLDKIITYGLCLFVFLLPWQTRLIYHDAILNVGVWEYGRLSLYGTEILLIVLLLLSLVSSLISKIFNLQFSISKQLSIINYQSSKIWLWIILLVIWSAITILWSGDKQLAWYGLLRLVEGIGLCWLITNKSQIGHQWRANSSRIIVFSLIISGVIQSLLAIWQWVNQWSFSSKWLGMAYLDPAVGGVSVIDNGAGRFLRAYGSLPHPNILAGFLVICLLIAVILYIRESSVKLQKWLTASMAVLSMGLFLTFSRAGWLILFSCLFVFLFICFFKKVRLKKLSLAILFIVAIFGILTYFYSDLVETRITGGERLEVKSNQERLTAYGQFWSIVKERWLTGVGTGQYTLALSQKYPAQASFSYQPVHDSGLLAWAELGLIGLILNILVIISAFRNKKLYSLLLIAILLLGCFDHYFRSFYFGIMLWWLVIGLNIKTKEE